MSERKDNVTMSHHDFKILMREYSDMALIVGHKRHLAKCANLCLNQVVTSVTKDNDDKSLCYFRDKEYIAIARKCIE